MQIGEGSPEPQTNFDYLTSLIILCKGQALPDICLSMNMLNMSMFTRYHRTPSIVLSETDQQKLKHKKRWKITNNMNWYS
jgi:hypothetical protein